MLARFLNKKIDQQWLNSNFPCMMACPAHTQAGHYVSLIAERRFEEAYHIARGPNPLASVCGRACAHPCEAACRRGKIDSPIAIRALKRFLTERYGPESNHPNRSSIERCETEVWQSPLQPKAKEKLPYRVAIVGAGPAGLSAAHDLALMGYAVTIFEAAAFAGGLLAVGIPEYRLPRSVLGLQVREIIETGDVTLKLNHAAGREFTISGLRQEGFDAVLIATGAHRSRELSIPGIDLEGVYQGLEFLRSFNLSHKVFLGKKVLVIGGGNVAVDVARSAARQVLRQTLPLNSHIDCSADSGELAANGPVSVSLAALTMGAHEVHMVCLEKRDEMPAALEEVEQAEVEGVVIHPGFGPKRILGKNGRVAALETLDTKWVFDQQGRFNPAFHENTEKQLECDTVIVAIGQAANLDFFLPDDGVQISRGLISVERRTLMTTAPGVFAVGECVFGPGLIIDAVRDGKRAAIGIDEYLQGRKQRQPEIEVEVLSRHRMFEEYITLAPEPIPVLPLERRIDITEVETGYDEEAAVAEARRCLRCWVNTVFEGNAQDGSECLLCGGCVDVCPEECLRLVPLEQIKFDRATLDAIREKPQLFDVELGDVGVGELGLVAGSAMLKDESRCIRCGLCALRCPASTITMEAYSMRWRAEDGVMPITAFDVNEAPADALVEAAMK